MIVVDPIGKVGRNAHMAMGGIQIGGNDIALVFPSVYGKSVQQKTDQLAVIIG